MWRWTWLFPLGAAGCGGREELELALDAALRSNHAEVLGAEVIELSADFTMGEAEEDAAAAIRAWYQAEVPCADTSLSGTTVEVDFGALEAGCSYAGHPIGGRLSVTVTQNDADEARLTHSWEALSSEAVEVTGGATVSWSATGGGRAVEEHLSWVDLDDGETVPANTEGTQTRLDPLAGWAGGVRVDGLRDWTTAEGLWTLVADGIELRGQDPVPQAGSWLLTTPAGEACTFSFERADDDTVEVIAESGARHARIQVPSTGG